MSGKGKTNGNGVPEDQEDLIPDVDFDPSAFTNIYVSYEQLVATWMWACTQSDLQLYAISNTLDINTLEREFNACCVPDDWDPPYQLRAEMSFYWPSEYTALSMDGDDAFCSLYHDDTEECDHTPGTAQVYTELEIEYHLPHEYVHRLDSDVGIEKVARHIRQVYGDLVDHENILVVDAKATFAGESLNLSSIVARHFWILEQELHDLPQLAMTFLDLAGEIRTVLERFAKDFPAAGSNSRRDQP